MRTNTGLRSIVVAGLVAALAGCGGGGGSSSTASAQPTLSADQTAFEQFTLAPNATYSVGESLPASGTPATTVNYLFEVHVSMAASPLTAGPQKVTETAPATLASTLTSTYIVPGRYVINGAIVVASTTQSVISYQGTGVRVDVLATDGTTVVDSVLRSGYSIVPLSGTVASAPSDLAQYLGMLYFNPALLNSTATWGAGSAYLKLNNTEINDSYTVSDYTGTTTGNTPTPVATGTTIAALMSTGGIQSTVDSTTYTLSNGTVSTINGVTTYVSTNVRPNLTTPAYRTYYELNGNVYEGSLVKAGTLTGGNPYPVAATNTTGYTLNYSQNYQIRLNAAAVSSLRAAVTF